MRSVFKIVPAMMAVAVMVSPAVAQSPSTPVSSDGTVGPATVEARPGSGKPFVGSGSRTEFTGAEPVSEAEALAAVRDFKPMTAGGSIESVIGWDTRGRIYPYNYYPFRAVVYITFKQGTGSYSCSGALINANTVLTAGHCVHSGGSKGVWSTTVKVYPAFNGSASPFGSCTAKSLHSVTGWTSSWSEEYDYGAIKLNCTIGNSTGWFGTYNPGAPNGLPALIAGYPGDKPRGTQWLAADKVATNTSRQVFYSDDTYGGMSGSGVWRDISSSGPYIFAVHAYGLHGRSPHNTYNHGVWLSAAVLTNYNNWRALP